MRSLKVALAALAATAALPAIATTMQDAGQAQPKAPRDYQLTKEVRQLVGEAQKLNSSGDSAGALARLQQALPLTRTADDRYVTGTVMIETGSKLNDTQAQEQGVETVIQSGALQGAELGRYHFFAGRFAYVRGDHAKAVTSFNAARENGHQDPQLMALIADSSLKANTGGGGIAALRQAVEAEIAAGRQPDENWLKRGVSIAYQNKQAEELAWWTQAQVRAYPTPQNWRTALITYRDGANLDPQAELDVMRLQRATRSLQGARDFFDYAQVANDRGLNGEVVGVIEEGRAAGQVDATTRGVSELYRTAQGRVGGDRTGLAREAAAAEKSTNVRDAMSVADVYLGFKDYANAAKFYQLALGRSGADAALLNTRLGIALALGGQKEQARAAFSQVTGPRQSVANYWQLFLEQSA